MVKLVIIFIVKTEENNIATFR